MIAFALALSFGAMSPSASAAAARSETPILLATGRVNAKPVAVADGDQNTATPVRGNWIVSNVTVIPADDDEVLTQRTVVIRDGRIVAIAKADAVPAPRDAHVIDGSGKFLIPGLVDAHVHISTEGALRGSDDPAVAGLDIGQSHVYDQRVMLTFLKAGVTAAANLGGSVRSDDDLLWLRGEIAAGRLLGPRLYVGKLINGPRAEVAPARVQPIPASSVAAPTTPVDGVAAVRAAHRRGYDFIKPYQFLNRDTYRAIVDESKREGFITTGHLPELGCAVCADRAFVFEHPMDNIAHAEELGRYGRTSDLAPADIDALADLVARRSMSVTPTLITLKWIVAMYVDRAVPPVDATWNALVDPVTRLDWAAGNNRYLSQAFRDQDGADTFSAGYDFSRVLTRALWKRGVPLTVGTDAPLPGLVFGVSVHQEMIELREIGLRPIEVLRAASINAHRLFDRSGGSGAVREGERADLVLLDADPLADVHNIARIAGVFVQGRWLSSADIDARLARSETFDRNLAQQIDARKRAAPEPATRPH